MKKQYRIFAVISVSLILFGLFLVTTPREQLLHYEVYTPLESYPMYYYTDFTVASSEANAELSFDLDIDFGGNYANGTTIIWNLYQLEPEQFEENFNLTEVRATMSGEDWSAEDFNASWAGWHVSGSFSVPWTSVLSGAYVFVFWIESDASTTGWSATLSFSLRTRIFSLL